MHETGEWQSQKCMNAFVSSDEVLDIGIAMLQAILTDALLSMPRIGPSMRLSVGDCICKEANESGERNSILDSPRRLG